MPMPMQKKEFTVEMKTLYNFAYILMHIRPFEATSSCKKTNLLGIYMFNVDNKNTRTRYETCLKLKLKNTLTRMTLSKVTINSSDSLKRTRLFVQ